MPESPSLIKNDQYHPGFSPDSICCVPSSTFCFDETANLYDPRGKQEQNRGHNTESWDISRIEVTRRNKIYKDNSWYINLCLKKKENVIKSKHSDSRGFPRSTTATVGEGLESQLHKAAGSHWPRTSFRNPAGMPSCPMMPPTPPGQLPPRHVSWWDCRDQSHGLYCIPLS